MVEDAEQARELATKAAARFSVAGLLNSIEAESNAGKFAVTFGELDQKAVDALRVLGFKVERNGGNVRVSWAE